MERVDDDGPIEFIHGDDWTLTLWQEPGMPFMLRASDPDGLFWEVGLDEEQRIALAYALLYDDPRGRKVVWEDERLGAW